MTNQLITHRLRILVDYSLISLMSSISYVWPLGRHIPIWLIYKGEPGRGTAIYGLYRYVPL